MKIRLLFFIFILGFNSANGCTCTIPTSLKSIQEWEHENSSAIYIVDVVELDRSDDCFEFKIVESFKGKWTNAIITGNYDSQCGPSITQKGRWLIYGDYLDGKFMVNACGLSRSFNNPEYNIAATNPPPPPPPEEPSSRDEIDQHKQRDFIWRKNKVPQAHKDLKDEIVWLRNISRE